MYSFLEISCPNAEFVEITNPIAMHLKYLLKIILLVFYCKEKSGFIKENYQNDFENEDLKINCKDYYFSNVIARSSKTMLDCNNSKEDAKRTGTEG